MKPDTSISQEWLILAPTFSISSENDEPTSKSSIVSFPHPRTSSEVKFLLKENASCNHLFELTKHKNDPSSWFVKDDHVKSDGSLYIASVFDPLYIFLSQLYKEKSGKFVILNQVFSSFSDSANAGQRLLKCLSDKSQLLHIADSAGVGDLIAYRYNETKALAWLKLKVEKIALALNETAIYIPEQNENSSEKEIEMSYASGMVCEYLPKPLHQTLLKFLGIAERPGKRSCPALNPSAKKPKVEALEDYTKFKTDSKVVVEKKNVTRTQKSLSKVDKKGMKPLSSFFASKPKKAT